MKKLFLIGTILLAFSLPAQAAFSVSQRVEVIYRISLGDGWDAGVQGQLSFSPNEKPQEIPVKISLLIRPYIRYTTDIVNEDEVSLSAYLRARLPWEKELVPAPAQTPTFSLNLQAGLDFSHALTKQLELLAGLEFDSEFAGGDPVYNFNGFTELSYALEDLSLYGGLSLDEILPTQAFSVYLGMSTDLTSITSISLNGAYDFSRRGFSLNGGLVFRLR